MKEKLKKLRDELLYVPKRARISESKMTSCLITCVASIVLCLICLGATSWAWFRGSVSTGVTEIQSGEFQVDAALEQTAAGQESTSQTKAALSTVVSYTLSDGSVTELDLSGVKAPEAVTGFAMDPVSDTDPDVVNTTVFVPLIDRAKYYTENDSMGIPLSSGQYTLTLTITKDTAYGYVDVVYVPAKEDGVTQWQRIFSSRFADCVFTVSVDVGEAGGTLYIGASWSDQSQTVAFLGISKPESTIGDTGEVAEMPTSEALQQQYDDAYVRYTAEYNVALAKAQVDAAQTLWQTLCAAVPNLEDLQTAYDKAKTAYETALAAYEAAKQSSEEATGSEATESESTGAADPDPEQLEQALADAKAAYEKAQATYEQAEAALNEGQAAARAAADAEKAYKEAEDAYGAEVAAYNAAYGVPADEEEVVP